MSYGIVLKNSTTSSSYIDDVVQFYPTQRGGIATSDPHYFNLNFFTAQTMAVSFDEYGNLITQNPSSTFSNINFDLNQQNFYGVANNLSKPTIIKICDINGYETAVNQFIFSNNYFLNNKIIRNYSEPNHIYNLTNLSPIGFSTSYFSNLLNSTYLQNSNFGYVSYSDTYNNINKYFLAAPVGSNISWYELPVLQFYYTIDYYLTNYSSSFNGISVPLSIFNGIIPTKGQLILINNKLNDTISGVYSITEIQSYVLLTQGSLYYNYPSQVFICNTNLDTSSSTINNGVCYYVPYSYGAPGKPFTKNLQLTQFIANNNPSSFMPMYKDLYTQTDFILYLNPKGQLTKQSDIFQLGVAVSNWFENSYLFGVTINYQIKEGF